MKLLIVLLALAAREFMRSGLLAMPKRWSQQWVTFWKARKLSGTVTFALVVGIPVATLALLLWALCDVAYDVPYLLVSLAVLVWVLLENKVPQEHDKLRELWLNKTWANEQTPEAAVANHESELEAAITTDLGTSDDVDADRSATAYLAEAEDAAQAEFKDVRVRLAETRLSELFAPLFWFIVLGPIAALTYYLVRLLKEDAPELLSDTEAGEEQGVSVDDATQSAQSLKPWLDWLPARVLSLTLALAGRFDAAWAYFKSVALNNDVPPVEIVAETVAHAVEPSALDNQDGTAVGAKMIVQLESVNGLYQRVLLIWIVLLALLPLWS